MDYERWDEMTMQSRCCECRCCNYWRLRQISSVRVRREIRFYRLIVVVLVFVTSLSLLALSLHCHWSNCIDEDEALSGGVTADDRGLPIEREASARMTSSTDPGDGDAPMSLSLLRAKREDRGQGDPNGIPNSPHHKRHTREKKRREKAFNEFRRKLYNAQSCGAVTKLVGYHCPSKLSSKGHQKKQRPGSSSLTTTTTKTMMTTTTKETCPMTNVSIEGSLDRSKLRTREEFRVCGPNNTESNDDLDVAVKKHFDWMEKVKKRGICVPMPLVIDLKPVKSTDNHDSGSTIVQVKRCTLLYKPIESEEDVTPFCHYVKRVSRTIHFKGTGGYVRSYEIYDDVSCQARMTSEENETHTPRNGKRCPWPFKNTKISATLSHCSCRKKGKGSAGYLVYRSCQMIVKGTWRLQDKQQECVRLGRCLPPKCKKPRVYDARTGRCVAQQQRHTTTPAAAAAAPADHGPGAASHPPIDDGQRPTRTAQQQQQATKVPTDT